MVAVTALAAALGDGEAARIAGRLLVVTARVHSAVARVAGIVIYLPPILNVEAVALVDDIELVEHHLGDPMQEA